MRLAFVLDASVTLSQGFCLRSVSQFLDAATSVARTVAVDTACITKQPICVITFYV